MVRTSEYVMMMAMFSYMLHVGSPRRQRIILRLADALIVTDSRLVIRVENMVRSATSSLEASEVDLNVAMSRSRSRSRRS